MNYRKAKRVSTKRLAGKDTWMMEINSDSDYAKDVSTGFVLIEKDVDHLGEVEWSLHFPHSTKKFAADTLKTVEKHVYEKLYYTDWSGQDIR